ncbi:hypothetical protein H0B56_06060 [Haloechinothrix sp. YIM 98757]|uniref:Uncharacterized protein n=1 Tax=Haloechinothrix aidingensis TaxID=2752311 RepID=A0A838A932_9PSEU|nr:hypothetical protein [Haloechinothrix aidingensis]MBA0125101.1 hypothetical protein [Haloechinothrix aidingensis]
MSSAGLLTRALGRVGDAVDASVRAPAQVAGTLRTVLAHRAYRGLALLVGSAVLVLYLTANGDLAFSVSGRWSGTPFAQLAESGLFDTRAPYLFEPLLVLHPGAHIAVFLSPMNILLGAVVAGLVGSNIAVAAYTAKHAVACRRPGYSGIFAAAPAFLLGFACCVPTFLLAIGSGVAATLTPILVPLRPIFYPLTLVLLGAVLVWTVRRSRAMTSAT